MSEHSGCTETAKSDNSLAWYAVHTRSNFEKRVAGELMLKGIECFLPVVREVHQWKDRKKLVEVPVFSGYVFVRFAASPEEQLTVLKTNGTARIVGTSGAPEPIPSSEIDSIRVLVDSGCVFKQHPFLKEGARVLVKRGPLRGIYGVLLTIKNTHRLILSITLLSQSVAAEIDMSDVEVTNSTPYGVLPSERQRCIQI